MDSNFLFYNFAIIKPGKSHWDSCTCTLDIVTNTVHYLLKFNHNNGERYNIFLTPPTMSATILTKGLYCGVTTNTLSYHHADYDYADYEQIIFYLFSIFCTQWTFHI